MKIAVLVLLLVACYASSEESVLNLLRDLKKNADLELETLEIAWQRRLQVIIIQLKNKEEVLQSLNSQLINQRAECQSKSDDVKSKVEDIENTSNYINWMLGRQKINIKRIDVLTANRCRQTNNYVNDVKNHKIALQLRLDGASFADVSRYNEKVNKFLKIYQSGKLLNMVEKMHMTNGHLEIPEIFEALDINEDILKSSRSVLLQQASKDDDSDSAADNTVVLIPGCDNTVGTVVVVQNDDGTGDSGNDAKITFSNGGGQSNGGSSSGHGSKSDIERILDGIENDEDDEDEDDDDNSDDENDSSSEASYNSDAESNIGESNSEDDGNSDSEGSSQPDDNLDDEDDSENQDDDRDNDSDGEDEDGSANSQSDDDNNDSSDDLEQDGDDTNANENKNIADNGSKTNDAQAKGKESETEDSEEGEPTTFQEVLDALEKHIKKQLDVSQNDEVRSSLGFIDFKLHVELENGTFDRQINHETEYSIKQNNQLKGRQQALVLCGARLKQLNVAIKLANDDVDAAKKYYLSQQQLKTEEVQTFDEVYDIYVQSTK